MAIFQKLVQSRQARAKRRSIYVQRASDGNIGHFWESNLALHFCGLGDGET